MATETIRPNAAGDVTQLYNSAVNQSNNYSYVDESSANDSDYVYNKGDKEQWDTDLYNIPSTAIAEGSTINKITFYARFKGGLGGEDHCKFAYKSGGTTYYSSAPNVTSSFAEYSWEQTTNQKTSAAWTIDDINALQIGVSLYRGKSTSSGCCSQLWIVIDYTEAANAIPVFMHYYQKTMR